MCLICFVFTLSETNINAPPDSVLGYHSSSYMHLLIYIHHSSQASLWAGAGVVFYSSAVEQIITTAFIIVEHYNTATRDPTL